MPLRSTRLARRAALLLAPLLLAALPLARAARWRPLSVATSGIRIATTRLPESAHKFTESFFLMIRLSSKSVPYSYRFEPIKESLIDARFTNIQAVVVRLEKELPNPKILARGLIYGQPDH